jgi:peptidyl-prolyl cis-trans isomerase B (cyclophilin B)
MKNRLRGPALAVSCLSLGALAFGAAGCSHDNELPAVKPTAAQVTEMKESLQSTSATRVIYQSPRYAAALALVPPDEESKVTMPSAAQRMLSMSRLMGSADKHDKMLLAEGDQLVAAHARPLVTVKTSKGTFVIQVDPGSAPLTSANFVTLAATHFYDGLRFHRYIPDFVIQGGDPMGTGEGGPGYTIPTEPGPLTHVTGAVAMAHANNPHTAGSQFYVVLAPAHKLDANYTVFGKVVHGMGVVQSLRVGDHMLKVTVSHLPENFKYTDPRAGLPSGGGPMPPEAMAAMARAGASMSGASPGMSANSLPLSGAAQIAAGHAPPMVSPGQ